MHVKKLRQIFLNSKKTAQKQKMIHHDDHPLNKIARDVWDYIIEYLISCNKDYCPLLLTCKALNDTINNNQVYTFTRLHSFITSNYVNNKRNNALIPSKLPSPQFFYTSVGKRLIKRGSHLSIDLRNIKHLLLVLQKKHKNNNNNNNSSNSSDQQQCLDVCSELLKWYEWDIKQAERMQFDQIHHIWSKCLNVILEMGSATRSNSIEKLLDDISLVQPYSKSAILYSDEILTVGKSCREALRKFYPANKLCANRSLVLSAVSYYGDALRYATEYLKNDQEIVLEAVTSYADALGYASESLRSFKPFVYEAAKRNALSFKFAAPNLQQDKDFVLQLVRINGIALLYCSDELKSDKEVVFEAVRKNKYIFEHAPVQLKDDKDFVMKIVKVHGHALQYASERLQKDVNVVMEAVKTNGCALAFAAPELADHYGVVLDAVSNNGLSLLYASDRLKDDPDIALTAVSQNGNALAFVSKRLSENSTLVTKAADCGTYHLSTSADEKCCLESSG